MEWRGINDSLYNFQDNNSLLLQTKKWYGTKTTYKCKEEGHLFEVVGSANYGTRAFHTECKNVLGVVDLWYQENALPACKPGLLKTLRKYDLPDKHIYI